MTSLVLYAAGLLSGCWLLGWVRDDRVGRALGKRPDLVRALAQIPEVTSVHALGPWLVYVVVPSVEAAYNSGAYEEIVGAELTHWSFGHATLLVRDREPSETETLWRRRDGEDR